MSRGGALTLSACLAHTRASDGPEPCSPSEGILSGDLLSDGACRVKLQIFWRMLCCAANPLNERFHRRGSYRLLHHPDTPSLVHLADAALGGAVRSLLDLGRNVVLLVLWRPSQSINARPVFLLPVARNTRIGPVWGIWRPAHARSHNRAVARRGAIFVLIAAIAFFVIDVHFGSWQLSTTLATREYWESGGTRHDYFTWWWYNDRWFE